MEGTLFANRFFTVCAGLLCLALAHHFEARSAQAQSVVSSAPSRGHLSPPDCTGPEDWPASIAFVHLKNAGLTNNDKLDFAKTTVVRLASERISKRLYRQVHDVTFTEKSGRTLEVITVSDASNEECSEGG